MKRAVLEAKTARFAKLLIIRQLQRPLRRWGRAPEIKKQGWWCVPSPGVRLGFRYNIMWNMMHGCCCAPWAVLLPVTVGLAARAVPAVAQAGGGPGCGSFVMERVSDTLSVLRIGGSKWELPWPVYRFQVADVNGDGSDDAIVGVEKSTRYDPVVRRRVFVYKNYRGHVRPLWLGSRLGRPVVDFSFVPSEGVLRVVESERSGRCLVADYRWRSFGMEFVRYVAREREAGEALRIMGGASAP